MTRRGGDATLPGALSDRNHWEDVYARKGEAAVSWYQPHLAQSLALIRATGIAKDASIIDVGGGASTLVDDLLALGFADITVVDLAESALKLSRQRLGERAGTVKWIAGDITRVELPRAAFDVWHDRAVFHFLTESKHRDAYLAQVCKSVKVGGHVVLAAFGPEGPEKCSGLPVVRYDAAGIHAEFGDAFGMVRHLEERHQTPFGAVQEFVYCMCLKQAPCATR
jgi:SAM-dependent methyltransferase